MKKIWFVLLVAWTIPAQAQIYLVSRVPSNDDKSYLWIEPQIAWEGKTKSVSEHEHFTTISFGYQWTKLGIFAQLSHGNLWGETVIGPAFQIHKNLNVGIGLGYEHYQKEVRLRLNSYFDHEETGSFFYTQFDVGKSDKWIWVDGARVFKELFGIGGLLQMPGGGGGPKFEFLATEQFSFWSAPVYDWQEKQKKIMFGIKFKPF